MTKQRYKSIYFSDHPAKSTKEKSVTLAFSEPEAFYYAKVKDLSAHELKELAGIQTYQQLSLFAEQEDRSINQVVKRLIKQKLDKAEEITGVSAKDVTFASSKDVPFQRWYPYIEGYSATFVRALIRDYDLRNTAIYEPFAGTGTTLFAADADGLTTFYSEVNPLLQFLIATKVSVLRSPSSVRQKLAGQLRELADDAVTLLYEGEVAPDLANNYQKAFGESVYFPAKTFQQVLRLRAQIDRLKLENELLADIVGIAVLACLLPVSLLKKAGDVRFKTAKELTRELAELSAILPTKLREMAADVADLQLTLGTKPELVLSNAKDISRVREMHAGAIITSPPYLNGTNYFRNTKLELWFLRYLTGEGDLRHYRDQALTSGINDVRKEYAHTTAADVVAKSPLLAATLDKLRAQAYDGRIPVMAKSYFEEMYQVFRDARQHLVPGAPVLIDIGDSVFCGVHISTDGILNELLQELGYIFISHSVLRKRRSRSQEVLTQSLLAFRFIGPVPELPQLTESVWLPQWAHFKDALPHQIGEFSKRNWGHPSHSLCSYQGKLKPSIAHHLIETFVPAGGRMLDPFAGVGTLPFEAALTGRSSFGIDISLPAYYASSAKVGAPALLDCLLYVSQLQDYLAQHECTTAELTAAATFGFNKTLADYYEPTTLREVLLARRFVREMPPATPAEMLVVSALLHILHGNRPYALSRRSHPIVPYAPTGDFAYRNLIENLRDKVERTFKEPLPEHFRRGKIFQQDATALWPQEIQNLDAIITSPPFFDSTRFYLANWIRIWFAGWSDDDFKTRPLAFVEEKQKKSFTVYEPLFRQARERLKKDGVFVLHLGKSKKCDMAAELQKISRRWFRTADLFDESVAHCESHGIRDKGTVTSHQYLVLS